MGKLETIKKLVSEICNDPEFKDNMDYDYDNDYYYGYDPDSDYYFILEDEAIVFSKTIGFPEDDDMEWDHEVNYYDGFFETIDSINRELGLDKKFYKELGDCFYTADDLYCEIERYKESHNVGSENNDESGFNAKRNSLYKYIIDHYEDETDDDFILNLFDYSQEYENGTECYTECGSHRPDITVAYSCDDMEDIVIPDDLCGYDENNKAESKILDKWIKILENIKNG